MLVFGADYCNAARGMMFALGCVQAQTCHTNRCPSGVATQDQARARALVVPDKAQRVHQFQRNTVLSFNQILSAVGLERPEELTPSLLYRRMDPNTVTSYRDLHDFLEPGELIAGTNNEKYRRAWAAADPDRFGTGN
jgi:Conserved region in glutamate synthase